MHERAIVAAPGRGALRGVGVRADEQRTAAGTVVGIAGFGMLAPTPGSVACVERPQKLVSRPPPHAPMFRRRPRARERPTHA